MKNYFRYTLLFISILVLYNTNAQNIKKEYLRVCKKNKAKTYSKFIKKYPKSVYSMKAKIARTKLDNINVLISTYLGSEKRNYYGNLAPEKLDTIWKLYLGKGMSPAYGKNKIWAGAGWTGQPLFVKEANKSYLIQGAFDYNLKKIDAKTGKIIWQYKFDDIIKGTGTIWVNHNETQKDKRYVIIQGSRLGVGNSKKTKHVPSLRAVSYITGKELWRMNVKATDSYSRDVDGSALVVNDTAYLALENALFTVFDPDYKKAEMRDSMMQAKIYQELQYYNKNDIKLHGNDLVAEASPTLIGDRIYTPSGTGWVYGYSIKNKKNDWEFYIGADLNGTAPATYDSCLLIAVEKQYIKGRGGVFKLNPNKKPENSVEWYFPTPDKKWYHWDGGIVGSVAVNDYYTGDSLMHIAAFVDISGYLYVVQHDKIDKYIKVLGHDDKTYYPCPKLLAKEKIIGTISSPIIVGDKIIVATDNGIFLFKFNYNEQKPKLTLLDVVTGLEIDATPIVYDGYVYIASRNGYLYCFGKK